MSPTGPIRNNTHFTILDEGPDHLVVDKPAPLKVHPGKIGGPTTLWDELVQLLAFEIANGGQVSIINRLDRETSGVTLIAKNAATARRYGLAMQNRLFQKTYLAWTTGWPEWESIECDQPMLRQNRVEAADIYVKQRIHPAGAPCRTSLRVLRRVEAAFGPVALVEAKPVTGRMHQIRVHLAHLGFPIIGDKLYGPSDRCYLEFIETGWTEALEKQLHLPRQALHAWKLELTDEAGHQAWQAPIPPELAALATP